MLLESLVKATVELQGFRVLRVTGDVAGLVAELAPDGRYAPRCGQCDQRGHYRDTWRVRRRFCHVPLWGIPVTLVYAPRRVQCRRCEGVHMEALPWAVGQQRFTRALLVTIATWARVLPWQQVATLFGCAWGTVERAVEAAVAYQSVVKVPRRTENGDAPAWQGATRENTGSTRPRSNAVKWDAAPFECSGTVTTGC